ncbi:MAG TPA: hypothetical protein VJL29_04020 [Thermoguttaceae bacterium]|nr:hypothetical protein [Thermoguttaceae bacterium]
MNPSEPLPDAAEPPRILMAEPSGGWAIALRRELGPDWPIEEARSLAECWARLARSPGSLAVVQLTQGNVESLLSRMARWEDEHPRARLAVVADRRWAGHAWLLREAGAVLFVTSPRRLAPLAALARRHLAAQPEPPISVQRQIWTNLPWHKEPRMNTDKHR